MHPSLFNKQTAPDIALLKEKIVVLISSRGPLLPVNVAKAINSNLVFAGALLSELAAAKKVFISKGKIGGSPLYYVKGQEAKLEMLRDYLGQRQKHSFDLLKEKKVVRESELEPVERVAMKDIPDFAVPLYVTIGDKTEVFWKWHLLTDEEAKQYIAKILEPEAMAEANQKVEQQTQAGALSVEQETEPEKQDKPCREDLAEKQTEKTPKLQEAIKKSDEKQKTSAKIYESPFRKQMLEFFNANKVAVLNEIPSGKKTEFYFVVLLPSPLAEIKFLAIAKSKKKISEDDVNLAFALGMHYKLPVILLAKELAKKAQKAAEEKGVAFKKL